MSTVRTELSLMWHEEFTAKLGSDAKALLDCDAESVCGNVIIETCRETDRFIKRLNEINADGSIEDSTQTGILNAVVDQCAIVLFG